MNVFEDDNRSLFVRRHGFLCEMAMFIHRRDGDGLKDILYARWGLKVSEEQAAQIKKELS
jgi:hypothetical protein